jgi:hypothetical protein
LPPAYLATPQDYCDYEIDAEGRSSLPKPKPHLEREFALSRFFAGLRSYASDDDDLDRDYDTLKAAFQRYGDPFPTHETFINLPLIKNYQNNRGS